MAADQGTIFAPAAATATVPAPPSAREEWRSMWPLPFVAMIGIAGSSMFSYSSGVFLGSMTKEFGWTRADFSSGFTIQMLLIVLVAPLIGRVIDRVGPRRMALIGIIPFTLAFAALGLANGSVTQWALLCFLQGLAATCISPVIWLTAVVGRFHASRGMALAIAQAGIGVSTAIWPSAAAYFIETLGWRPAFGALVLCWAIPVLPLTFFLFFGPRDRKAAASVAHVPPPPAERPKVARLLLSKTFVCLILAGALFSMVSLGTTLHMVPLLQSNGFDLTTAAWIASIAGIATLLGRLGTGVLLDRYPAKIVAIITFLVPILPVLLLWQFKGSFEVSVVAVVIFGFTAGAESDVVAYIASRLLPATIFASGYAIIIAVFAVFASMGPLLASHLYDLKGSYDLFLLLVVPVVIVGAALMAMLPRIAPLHHAAHH